MDLIDRIIAWFRDEITRLWGSLSPVLGDAAEIFLKYGEQVVKDAALEAIGKIAADPTILANKDRLFAAADEVLAKIPGMLLTEAVTVVQMIYNNLKAAGQAPANAGDAPQNP